MQTRKRQSGHVLGRKHISVSKFFSPVSPDNAGITKSIPRIASSYNFTCHQWNRALFFLSWQTLTAEDKVWQLAQNTVHVQTSFKCFSPGRSNFHHFHLTQAPTSWFLGGNLWGAGNTQPPWAKGTPKLFLRSTPFLFNNGISKKNTEKNNHIPSKNASKSFLVNYMHSKSFVRAFILSKPSHFLCQ